jgi:putative LysE/RhtB family amino acid efflux pump
MHAGLVGFGLGFIVALQLGPMSLLLIRSTLRAGWMVGVAVGLGIAAIDGLYAAVGAAGAAPLLQVEPARLALGILGAGVLLTLGLRTLRSALRVRVGGEADAEVATPGRAFRTSLVGTASNPATIASWGAIFAAASAAGAARGSAGAVVLVLGVAVGSFAWVSALATCVAIARRALGERGRRLVEILAGSGMLGFGGALAYATAHDR